MVFVVFNKKRLQTYQLYGKIYNKNLLPESAEKISSNTDNALRRMNFWLQNVRCIPSNRADIENKLELLKIKTPKELVEKSMGFSLNDNYWYGKNARCGHLWNRFNFFDNKFSEDIGNLVFDGYICKSNIDFIDPASTTNGQQDKMWVNSDGKALLVKGETMTDDSRFHQSANEVIASKISEILNLDHVSYTLGDVRGRPVCICENFASKDNEYIPLSVFDDMRNDGFKSSPEADFNEYRTIAEIYGIPREEFDKHIEKVCAVICIMLNTDYNKGNIGFCVEKHNGKVISASMSPFFDNGTSNGVAMQAEKISRRKDVLPSNFNFASLKESFEPGNKIFGRNYDEVAARLGTFTDVDLSKLKDIRDFAYDIYVQSGINESIAAALSDTLNDSISNFISIVERNRTQDISFNENNSFCSDVDKKINENHYDNNHIDEGVAQNVPANEER